MRVRVVCAPVGSTGVFLGRCVQTEVMKMQETLLRAEEDLAAVEVCPSALVVAEHGVLASEGAAGCDWCPRARMLQEEIAQGLRCEFTIDPEVMGLCIGKNGANITRALETGG